MKVDVIFESSLTASTWPTAALMAFAFALYESASYMKTNSV